MLQRCNWNCRWHHHPQMQWWQSTINALAHTHADRQRTWACLQWQEMCHKTAINQIFWLDLWQGWCTPRILLKVTALFTTCCPQRHPLNCRSSLAWSHTCLPSCPLGPPLQHHLCEPAKEGCWVHLEWNIPRCLWLCEEPSTVPTPLCATSTFTGQSSSKLRPPRKALEPALLQDRHPVTFASKALTPTKQSYTNIEHELLTCVFGVQSEFCTWFWMHKFTVESDHKPLEPDYAQEPGRCTSPPPANAVTPQGLWPLHQILTQ